MVDMSNRRAGYSRIVGILKIVLPLTALVLLSLVFLLARTIASGAPWLLADEPLASLDPFHQLQVMKILKDHANLGGAVLVAMHDLDLAQRYCDRLILLHESRLIGQGKPEAILNDQNLADVFGVSATRWTSDGLSFLATKAVGGPNGDAEGGAVE